MAAAGRLVPAAMAPGRASEASEASQAVVPLERSTEVPAEAELTFGRSSVLAALPAGTSGRYKSQRAAAVAPLVGRDWRRSRPRPSALPGAFIASATTVAGSTGSERTAIVAPAG